MCELWETLAKCTIRLHFVGVSRRYLPACRLNPEFLDLITRVRPVDWEMVAMLRDLYQRCGWPTVCALLGAPDGTICTWLWGAKNPSASARKAVWLVWSLLCRPGQIQTAFDIATCGRFTESGGPQHAGKGEPVKPIKPPKADRARRKKPKPPSTDKPAL